MPTLAHRRAAIGDNIRSARGASLNLLVEIGVFEIGSHAARDHDGKGERDQLGSQYTTAHRILGQLPMSIAKLAHQAEAGGEVPEAPVPVERAIDTPGAGAYTQRRFAVDSIITREAQRHSTLDGYSLSSSSQQPPRFRSGEEEGQCQKSGSVKTSHSSPP